jgi:uncharacterized protein (TIGR02599 family)
MRRPLLYARIHRNSRRMGAFTLVEILVSLAVLAVLLLISAQVIGQVQNTWTTSNARVNQFREARVAFDIITRNLSQATLNTYIDYDKNYLKSTTASALAANAQAPSKYERNSDLQFITGPANLLVKSGSAETLTGHAVFFQAPLGVVHNANYVGLDRLLCGRGYFVQYTSDEFFRPEFLPAGQLRYRYRLMEFSPPAEKNLIYDNAETTWYAQAGIPLSTEENPTNVSLTRPVADNILTLIISPLGETEPTGPRADPTWIAPTYSYNSREKGVAVGDGQGTQHLLPPLVKVVLVAIDERSAERLSAGSDGSSPPFGSALSAPQDSASQLEKELERISSVLRDKRVNFRIFSSTVSIRGAKWNE